MISFLQRKIDNFQFTVLNISCLMVVCFFSIQSLQAQVTLTTSTSTSPTTVCGQLFTVTIDAANGFTNLLSVQYNVGWDPAKADYISSAASLFSVDAPLLGTTNTSGGRITINNPNCQAGATGDVTALATGGTSGYTYLWSTGTAAAMASNLTAGTYLVTATDVNGCTAVCPTTARG